jgi:hypothetical protein
MTLDELSYFTARASWRCVECGSSQLTAKLDGDEAVPDSSHWCTAYFCCPVLMPDSAAMVQCWMDVWEALAEVGCPLPGGDYVLVGDPTATVRGAL